MGSDKNRTYKILGVTGGVGAGKSTVLSYLKDCYGAYILEADKIGHQVQQPGEPCFDQIVAAFGDEILDEDGRIDRGRLGAIVYADREKLIRLNRIVHPAVKARICGEIDRICEAAAAPSEGSAGIHEGTGTARRQAGIHEGTAAARTQARIHEGTAAVHTQDGMANLPFVLIVIEAALLLEDHYDEICDEVWYIYADEQTRVRRLIQSRGYTGEKAWQIMSNQMSEEEFRRRCPVVIDNNGEELWNTCARIDRELGRLRNL